MTHALGLYPFVPSGRSFDAAKAFFAEIGFVCQWENGGCAGLRSGNAYFILQEADIPEWASNQMLVLEVADLDEWWRTIASKDLQNEYAGVQLKEPIDYPWGREVHLIDPAGVCWHIRQKP